jgi:16S rRNA (guanine966-N2)-methyltransferase
LGIVRLRFCRDGRTEPLRVIAGQYRSRPLRSLPGPDIRPTADRLRETLFNVLTAGNPGALEGSTWADLYAGTGSVGIEALSRGAGKIYLVESFAAAARLIRENLDSLQVTSGVEIMLTQVSTGLRRLEAQAVALDYVFLDPPYHKETEYRDTLVLLGKSSLLRDTTVVMAEHLKKFDPGEEFGSLRRYRKLVQSDATLSFYRRS